MELFLPNTDNKTYNIITENKLMNELLEPWRDTLGEDFDIYRNHVLRMINYCFFILEPNKELFQKIIITAVYHQLGLWQGKNDKYYINSVDILLQESKKYKFNPVSQDIITSVLEHNNFSNQFNKNQILEDAFWKAFRIEVTMGHSRQGLPIDFIDKVKEVIPLNHYYQFIAGKNILNIFHKIKSFI